LRLAHLFDDLVGAAEQRERQPQGGSFSAYPIRDTRVLQFPEYSICGRNCGYLLSKR
jgi:hypothetical protein